MIWTLETTHKRWEREGCDPGEGGLDTEGETGGKVESLLRAQLRVVPSGCIAFESRLWREVAYFDSILRRALYKISWSSGASIDLTWKRGFILNFWPQTKSKHDKRWQRSECMAVSEDFWKVICSSKIVITGKLVPAKLGILPQRTADRWCLLVWRAAKDPLLTTHPHKHIFVKFFTWWTIIVGQTWWRIVFASWARLPSHCQ